MPHQETLTNIFFLFGQTLLKFFHFCIFILQVKNYWTKKNNSFTYGINAKICKKFFLNLID